MNFDLTDSSNWSTSAAAAGSQPDLYAPGAVAIHTLGGSQDVVLRDNGTTALELRIDYDGGIPRGILNVDSVSVDDPLISESQPRQSHNLQED